MCTRTLFFVSVLAAAFLPLRAADTLIITEFAANNVGPLVDEDGDSEDWIEIHNPSTNTVSLAGWFITDDGPNLVKWMFPATNIGPNGYLIVWASNKDRRVPGRPLHTNFRLNDAGEYLGLIRPDLSISWEYHPNFPAQIPRVSYGVPITQTSTTLLSTGAAARVYIPTNDVLGSEWILTGFDDTGWLNATTGVGYEMDSGGPFTPMALANSVTEFSGKQGSNNWYYGFWDRKADPNGVYSDIDMGFFPNVDGPYGENNFWNGSEWDWFNGDPPFTQITAQGATPNQTNGIPTRDNHWAIRRWVSEVNGLIKISGTITHTGDWAYVTQTGVAANSSIYVYLTAAGDGFIDDMKIVAGSVPEAGVNLLPNGDFEAPLSGPWTVSANHAASALSTTVKRSGNSSLYISANAGGTTQASAIWQNITPALTVGSTYTISYWYKPTSNNTPLVVRFSGNWINTSPTPCGDGVTGRILVNGNEVFQQNAVVSSHQYNVTIPVTAGARVDFALDPRASDFCDASIFTAQIETANPGDVTVANSVSDWSFSGTQGENSWFYGYYNRTADAGGVYAASDFIPFPRASGSIAPNNYWDGSKYDWYNGNPPWDEIGQTGMHPNGINNSAEHWVIRRWVSEVSGRLEVDWTVSKTNPNGNGVTGRVFHNGVQVDSVAITGNNTAGASRTVAITNVSIGDFIDIALDPTGPGGQTDDGSDGSAMTAVIRGTPTLTSLVATSIQSQMHDVNASAYLRIPFTVADPSSLDFLTLRMRYDDGFVAYLNGVQVAARNAPFFPEPLTWNSSATTNRADGDSALWETFDISAFAAVLQPGGNVLAIHGLNSHPEDSDFLILPELTGINVTFGTNAGYFSLPTPGSANGAASTNLGPLITDATHTPNVPLDSEALLVRAQITPTFHALSNVTLVYRVGFGAEVSLPMADNGFVGDGAAGDGVFAATIPASAANLGQMIRYYVTATDVRTNRSRLPFFDNVLGSPTYNALTAPEYFGTIVHVPQTNNLPIMHWFIQNTAAAATEAGTRGAVFFNGQFADNVGITLHGQSSAGFPKKSHNFNLNPGYKMQVFEDGPDVSDFAVGSTWADRTHVRNRVNQETYIMGGVPAHISFPVRIHQNETFYMVANVLEQGDEEYLERIGYDPNGALYKMYNTFTGAAGNEKKTRRQDPTGTDDLQSFYNALVQPDTAARITWLWDNINVPNMINFLALKAVGSDHDCCHKNYYYYRDTDRSGEWYALPWDFDLSYGHVWTQNNGNYFDDTTYTNLFIGVGNNNTQFSIMWNDPTFRAMWIRRTRTLMDELLQPPGTSASNDVLRARLEYWTDQVRADATLDKVRWGGASWTPVLASHGGPANPTDSNPTNNFEVEVSRVKNFYLQGRRTFLNLPSTMSSYAIPTTPQPNVFVRINAVDYNPPSANQAQEYIELRNTNTFAVDISGWRITGAVDFTFAGGTIIPASSNLYVSPDVRAFRARNTGPRGGQRLQVVGPYEGQLSARGESLALLTPAGATNSTLTYPGTPSLAQQYLRITEIMYHPAPAAGSPFTKDEFEYIELKNIGPVAIDLTGVHFTNGITFTFTSATRTNIAAGERLILARNLAAFTSRYPNMTNVIGPYVGALDNNGEQVRLDDAVGEKILDFDYNNSWYPMTDGNGLSLVIVNENAPWFTWGDKVSWRPSGDYNGTPGAGDGPALTFAPILVNEVLTHTDPPAIDFIELYNPTTNDVDISNWLISDDFSAPRKYRISPGTILSAGGYIAFAENQFNVGPNSFSFSSKGDEAYLFSGDAAGNPNGYFHGFEFGGAQNGVAFGRYTNSVGAEHFVAQSANTPTSSNALPKVGPVVISEIMYHPPDLIEGTNVIDNELDEFIELHNITGTPVALHDSAYPTNRWLLANGIEFAFSTNDVIAANGYMVVVNFNPTNTALLSEFRAKYGTPLEVPIVGPYSGKLSNDGETLELNSPDTPDAEGVPYFLVERIEYLDVAPWGPIADGFGASLVRIVTTDYGNDPTNFVAAAPSPGLPPVGDAPPVVTQQPANASVFLNGTTNFIAHVAGDGVVYQWLHNGVAIPGARSAVLMLTNVQNVDAGTYSYYAFNGAGSAVSSNATLTVVTPVLFTIEPVNQQVQPGSTVTLVSEAVGNGTILYQWRFEGVDIPGATNATYSFTNANLSEHHGNFSVAVWDDISSAVSSNAFIYVRVNPGVVQHITSQSVLQGGSVTFTVIATGAPPLGYRWVRDFGQLPPLFTSEPTLTLTDIQKSGNIRVVVTNLASFGGVQSPVGPPAQITMLADFDQDGVADVWESAYFGAASTNNPNNALEDPDGDTMINRDEYLAGTNPTNALSLLKVIFSATNDNVITFVAQTNKTYSVQIGTNLSSVPAWLSLSNITASPQVRTIQVNTATAPGTGERYFRIVTPLAP